MTGPLFLRWLVLYVVALSVVSIIFQRLNWTAIALMFGISVFGLAIEFAMARRQYKRSEYNKIRGRAKRSG